MPLDTAKFKRELDPNPTTDAYLVVLQIGEHVWYRTPDIRPEILWNNLSWAVNSLGQASTSPTGDTQLILPAFAKRRITLLYPDGRPAASDNVTVSIYVWNMNHCGAHVGLPLGTFRTDRTGTIEVLAPLVSLYLDSVSYYQDVGPGPAGRAYSFNSGLKTGPELNLVLKEQWEFTEDDDLSEDVELRVLTPDGRPRKDVDVYGNWRTNTCGGHDRIGQTDSEGVVQTSLDPSFTGLELMVGGPYSAGDPKAKDNSLDLSYDDLRELFAKHKLTIRW